MSTSERYRRFGEHETGGQSPAYHRLAVAVADDPELVRLLDGLAEPKRQPNLLFAAVRYHGGPVEEPAAFRDWLLAHWDRVAATMRRRRTQTNEPGRCATLLPVLAGLTQPLALIEVGASAGLCLYPDRYRYRYGDVVLGPPDSPVQLECAVTGPGPVPQRVPTVVWRAGIDLNPLDLCSDDDLRWLDALIWPGQPHRHRQLHAAAGVVRADPPRLVTGDLLTALPELAAQAPPDATLVVFHTAVLSYLSAPERQAFRDLVRGLPGHWICNESPAVFPDLDAAVPPGVDPHATFLLSLDEQPLALTAPHGQHLRWLAQL